MRLFELANNPYDIEIYDEGLTYITYKFVTDRRSEYYVNIEWYDETISVEFDKETAVGVPRQGILNTGDAFRIFATIAKAIKTYLAGHQPINRIEFMGKQTEPSRIKLYDQIAKVFPRHIPNFKFVKKDEDVAGGKSYYVYIFERIGTS